MNTNHNRIKVADLEINQRNRILTTKENGELEFSDIDAIKVDSYNALDYNQEGKALDARQGKVLKDLIDNLKDTLKPYFDNLYLGISNDQNISGIKTFLAGKLGLRNVANTFTSFFLNANTASRTYTLQNRDGTLLDNTDLSSINSSLATKQSVFTGVANYITKSLNATTLSASRLFDNGMFFGIGTSKIPVKDITLGNQSNREIGIEQSESNNKGQDLTISAGRTINYLDNINFVALNQISIVWLGIGASRTTKDVYAITSTQDIYKQVGGIGNFIALNQGNKSWRAVSGAYNGDIYACTYLGDIYKQTGGIGNFSAIGAGNRAWSGIANCPNGDIYACVQGGDIYKQAGGIGPFVALSQTIRNWYSMSGAPNGDVYACVQGGDIYKQIAGIGNFLPMVVAGNLTWTGITTSVGGNIYASTQSGDIYKQTNGTGTFNILTSLQFNMWGVAVTISGNLYAAKYGGDIFFQNNDALGISNLQGGSLRLKSGTGKGIGQSRIEFITGQKTVSGTDMQIETTRSYIDENGYMIWNLMPTFDNNGDAIAGGLPIGCEYKTATGDRKIVY